MNRSVETVREVADMDESNIRECTIPPDSKRVSAYADSASG